MAAAVESCLRQTFRDIEVICVDDGSTDSTPSIIDQLRRGDDRVTLIQLTENRSAFQARRVGIEAARSPYVMFLDGDDELAPDAVEVSIELAHAQGADVVALGVEVIMPDNVRKPAFEKTMQPAHKRLTGAEILPGVFPIGKTAHGHIWGYLFATELVREAYVGLPTDIALPRANDIPISFLAIASASSYVSTPKPLYRYFFRRGTSGHGINTVEDFPFHLGSLDSIDLIAEKVRDISTRQEVPELTLECYESARLSTIALSLRYAIGAATPAVQDECVAALSERIGNLELLRAAVSFCPEGLSVLGRRHGGAAVPARPVKKVLLTTADLRTGGVQGVVVSQAQLLVEAGFAVTIAVHRTRESVYDLPPEVEVLFIDGDTPADKLTSWAAICRETGADVILDHHVLYNRTWPFYALVARDAGVPTIGFLQSFALRPIRDDNDNMSFLIENLPLLNTVVTLSATDVAHWKLRGLERVVTLPNPPSPLLRELANATTAPRKAPVGPIKLVWWGRLQESTKQVRALIRLAEALRTRGVAFQLTIIGPDTSDLTAADLLKDAIARGVDDTLSLPGALHGDDLLRELDDAHVYVSTSIIEGSPLALVEAQALGLPVAMFELPWLSNLDGNDGVLTARQGDVGELATAIADLSASPDRYVALSSASLDAARRATDFDYPALYRMLVANQLPPAHSPEPTEEHARLLLEWASFYAELNADEHARMRREITTLRRRIKSTSRKLRAGSGKTAASRRLSARARRRLGALKRRLLGLGGSDAMGARKAGKGRVVDSTAASHAPKVTRPAQRPTQERGGRHSGPDVSVVVPVYNSAPWLDQCVTSVLGQTGVTLELICVNDGSVDESREILAKYAEADERVHIIDQPNSGQSVGRNVGLDAARGRYVIYLDSDDYWDLDGLADLVRRADEDQLDLLMLESHAVRDGDVDDEVWNRYSRYYPRHAEYSEVRKGINMMVAMRRGHDYRAHVGLYLARTSYVRSTGIRFIPGIVHQDNPYTFALLMDAERVAHTKTDLYARRLRPGSTITTLKTASSAKGYFLSYLSMLHTVSNREIPAAFADVIAGIVHSVFLSARKQFALLPDSIGDEFKDLDSSAEAQLVYRILRNEREEVRAS